MKKLILVLTAIAVAAGAYAQADSANKKMRQPYINSTDDGASQNRDIDNNQFQNIQDSPVDKSEPDGVMMQNGKMMMVKDGKAATLDHEMTMNNGIIVMSNGSYIKRDGTKVMFNEGERMDLSGNITPMKSSNPKLK